MDVHLHQLLQKNDGFYKGINHFLAGLEAWIDWATRGLECHEVGVLGVQRSPWFSNGNYIGKQINR